MAGLIIEIVITAVFVYVILGATDDRAPKGFAPIAIGLALTVVNLVAIPVTNCSANPARSLGVAWFAGTAALAQQSPVPPTRSSPGLPAPMSASRRIPSWRAIPAEKPLNSSG